MNRTLTSLAALLREQCSGARFLLEPKTFGPSRPRSFRACVRRERHERALSARQRTSSRACGTEWEKPLVGRLGDPAGYVRLDQVGFLIVGYRSNPARVDLEAEKFTSYLREEGLESIIEERDERGEALAVGRESYSRCAKALLTVGPGPSEGFDRRLGFNLEIVPEVDPTHLTHQTGAAGFEPLPVRVFRREQGAAGILVGARNLDDPKITLHVRADEDGRARLDLPCAGRWLIKAVAMERAPEGSDHDWSSLWAR
jgi:hypothetical protein